MTRNERPHNAPSIRHVVPSVLLPFFLFLKKNNKRKKKKGKKGREKKEKFNSWTTRRSISRSCTTSSSSSSSSSRSKRTSDKEERWCIWKERSERTVDSVLLFFFFLFSFSRSYQLTLQPSAWIYAPVLCWKKAGGHTDSQEEEEEEENTTTGSPGWLPSLWFFQAWKSLLHSLHPPPSLGRWPPRPLPFLLLTTTILLVVHHPPPLLLVHTPHLLWIWVGRSSTPSFLGFTPAGHRHTKWQTHRMDLDNCTLERGFFFFKRRKMPRKGMFSLSTQQRETENPPPPPFVTAGTVLRTRKGRRVGCCFSFP